MFFERHMLVVVGRRVKKGGGGQGDNTIRIDIKTITPGVH